MATQSTDTKGASKEAPDDPSIDPRDAPTPHAAGDPFSGKGPQDTGGIVSYSAGNQLFDPGLYAGGGGHSAQTGITAWSGGGQLNATPLTASINRVTVSRAAGDSVALPVSTGGQIMVVLNGANVAVQVFAANGTADTINNIAGNTGVSLASAKAAMFCSARPGSWFWILSA